MGYPVGIIIIDKRGCGCRLNTEERMASAVTVYLNGSGFVTVYGVPTGRLF